MPDVNEERVSRIVRELLDMAARANTALGASWEHGARSASMLQDAVALIGELRAEVERVHAALRSVEWSSVARIGGAMVLACPACRRHEREGHAVYCPIREAIAGNPTAEPTRLHAEVERLTRERALDVERLDMLREVVDAATMDDDDHLADWIREHLLPHAERLGLGPVDDVEQGP